MSLNSIDELIQFIENEPIVTSQLLAALLKDVKIMLTSDAKKDAKKVEQIIKKYDNILYELEKEKGLNMSSSYEREICAQNLQWFNKVAENYLVVIERLYKRIQESEKNIRSLITSFSADGVDYMLRENSKIADWLNNKDEQEFLESVKEKYVYSDVSVDESANESEEESKQ